MNQNIENNKHIDSQFNINSNYGSIGSSPPTRFAKRFAKLIKEVSGNEAIDKILVDLNNYITKLDGIDLETKLQDGGFSLFEIEKATRRKEAFAKKLEMYKFFESSQWINAQLFSQIISDFETYIEPLIKNNSSKEDIIKSVAEKVVSPILNLLNQEGERDEYLNYTTENIWGMIYYLTGKCHINWKDYDIL